MSKSIGKNGALGVRARVVVLVALICACGDSSTDVMPPLPEPGEGEGVVGAWVRSAGRVRTYDLFTPTDLVAPVPIIVVLHGSGGSGSEIRAYSGFDEVAAALGYLVVYPDGVEGSWAAGCDCTASDSGGVDDLLFFRTLLSQIASEVPIDPERVFFTGFSQGSMMGQRVVCEAADLVAGFAGVGAGLTRILDSRCQPFRPVPVAWFHGVQDRVVPWTGNSLFLAVLDSTERWAAHNGCNGPERTELPDVQPDSTTAWLDTYANCSASVLLYGIEGGGHTWPGAALDFIPSLGLMSEDISATNLIINFFDQEAS